MKQFIHIECSHSETNSSLVFAHIGQLVLRDCSRIKPFNFLRCVFLEGGGKGMKFSFLVFVTNDSFFNLSYFPRTLTNLA